MENITNSYWAWRNASSHQYMGRTINGNFVNTRNPREILYFTEENEATEVFFGKYSSLHNFSSKLFELIEITLP